jgi:hypothetical protein
MKRRIISIAAGGENWWTVYSENFGVGDEPVWFHPVALFALVESDIGITIEPIDALDINEGIGGVASDASNYVGLAHSFDFDVPGETLNSQAEKRLGRG